MSAVSSERLPWPLPRPSLGGAAVVAAGVAVLGGAIVIGQTSAVGLAVAGAVLALLLAVAALRWPRTVIVLVVITPILDRYIVADWLPADVAQLTHFMSEGLLLTVGIALAVQAWRRGTLVPALRHPATVGLAAFAAASIVSTLVNAVRPEVAALGIGFTVDAAACFYLPRLVGFSVRQSLAAVGILVAIVTIAALGGLAQWVLRPDFMGLLAWQGRYGEIWRLASIFSDPNTFGALLIATIPFAVFGAISLRRQSFRIGGLVLAIVHFVPLYLSFSRGAWAGLLVGGGVALAIISWRAVVAAVVLAALSFGIAISIPREVLVEDPEAAPNQPSLVDSTGARIGEIGAGGDLRTLFVLHSLEIIGDHPIVGVGPGQYGGAAASIFGSPVYDRYGTDELIAGSPQQKTVDNFWLHTLVETGVLGLAALAGAMLAAWIPIVRAARRSDGWRRVLLGGIAGGVAAMAANTVTTMLLEANAAAFPIWFLLGLGSILVARMEAEERGEVEPEAVPAA